jgi:hypothetical protein
MSKSSDPATSTPGSPQSGAESRSEKRYRGRKGSGLRLAIRPSFQNLSALVHDLSASGIGFLLDRPLEPGTTLALQLKFGRDDDDSVVRTARVVHVRPHLPVNNAPWVKRKPLLKVMFSFLAGGKEEKSAAEKQVWLVGCRMSPPLSPEELIALTDGREV